MRAGKRRDDGRIVAFASQHAVDRLINGGHLDCRSATAGRLQCATSRASQAKSLTHAFVGASNFVQGGALQSTVLSAACEAAWRL